MTRKEEEEEVHTQTFAFIEDARCKTHCIVSCKTYFASLHCVEMRATIGEGGRGGGDEWRAAEKIDALWVLGLVSFSPQMPFHCVIASQPLYPW